MCLYIDKDKTAQEKLNTTPRVFYKLFLKSDKILQTPYMRHAINGPGKFTAPQADPSWLEYNKGMVGPGAFHARTSKEALKQDLFWAIQFELGACIFLRIVVHSDYIIAYGNQDNVTFTEYTISEEVWKEAVRSKPLTMKDLQ